VIGNVSIEAITNLLKYLPGSAYVWLGCGLIFSFAPRPTDIPSDWWTLAQWASWIFFCVRIFQGAIGFLSPLVRSWASQWKKRREANQARQRAVASAFDLAGPPTAFLLDWLRSGDRHGQFEINYNLDILAKKGIAQFVSDAGYGTYFYEIDQQIWQTLQSRRHEMVERVTCLTPAISRASEIARARGRI